MISVSEAKKIIVDNTAALQPVDLPLHKAMGLTLTENVIATMDIPAFPQSSMDGYAFAFNDWDKINTLRIAGEVAAGNEQQIANASGNAVRIFTGGAVPTGADTVVMQEKVIVKGDTLTIQDDNLQAGNNVRPKGSEIKAGSMALEAGSQLSPAAIGFLAGIGISSVKVYSAPRISIIITGNELQQPGKPLRHGQVYESNSFALQTALLQLHIADVSVLYARDTINEVTTSLEKALQQSEIVLLTGGISVGDYDFVLEASARCKVEQLFHKVKQRPGKPLFFGRKENKLVFGLPGNPSSVLTCFYEYVVPALEKMSQRKKALTILQARLANAIQKNTTLTHFLKGYYESGNVTTLDAQESYRLSSFARANCLIKIDEQISSLNEGDLVEIHLLPD